MVLPGIFHLVRTYFAKVIPNLFHVRYFFVANLHIYLVLSPEKTYFAKVIPYVLQVHLFS